jgi:hypothetical protein
MVLGRYSQDEPTILIVATQVVTLFTLKRGPTALTVRVSIYGTKSKTRLQKSGSSRTHNYHFAHLFFLALASSKFLAMALTLLVMSVVAGAIFFDNGISVPYSSSKSPAESTAVQTSVVLQTVNLTKSLTTVVPLTTFTTLTVTKTSTNYYNITQTFNSTEVTTDLIDSTNVITTTTTSSVTTNITYTSISIQTDVIVQHRR